MNTILALESSAETCSVALLAGGDTLLKIHDQARQHAQVFLPLVDAVLSEAQLSLSQVDAIAFSRGPGSFTGIRICLGVVQGLALGAELPVIPVSTLQALAVAGGREGLGKPGDHLLTAFDARMQEVYCAEYCLTDSIPQLITDEAVLPIAKAQDWLNSHQNAIAVGSAWSIPELAESARETCFPELVISALDIVNIAQVLYEHGKAVAIDDAAPVYLRNEVTWKKRQPIRKAT